MLVCWDKSERSKTMEEQKRTLVGMHVSPVVGKEYPDLTDPYSQTLQFLKDKERKNVS